MNYSHRERIRAVAWKTTTSTLPDHVRTAAPYVRKDGAENGPAYEFCLPAADADLSLLPEVRAQVLASFAEVGIPWHAGVNGGPSNHLLSSQVQCANALGQMLEDPDRIVRAFGELVEIGEILQIVPDRYLRFEYVGPTDFFGEARGGPLTPGANCTSIDAAFLHRARDGVVELVLIEWKYTESYRVRQPDAQKDATRQERYAAFVADKAGPVDGDVLAFDLLLDEPFYQLVRQQLLAHELEKNHAEGAGRVRVLHVLSPQNLQYQQSFARPEHRALGDTVSEVWHQLLRSSDRFSLVDPALFLDPEITSREYCLRYAEDVIYDTAELMEALGVQRVADIEDVLYAQHDYDGDVLVDDAGIELIVGREGTGLEYPFRLTELRDLADELSLEDENE